MLDVLHYLPAIISNVQVVQYGKLWIRGGCAVQLWEDLRWAPAHGPLAR